MNNFGKIIEHVEIIDMASEGKCVAKVDGKVYFVQQTAPGDIVDIKIIKKEKNFFEAVPVHFHQYSSMRTTPVCAHFGVCGGCKWQHIDYQTQLFFKQKQVNDALERIAKVPFPTQLPIIGSEEIFFYRNKLDFTFSSQRWLTENELNQDQVYERRGLGFHIPGRFDKVLDIDQCHLQSHISNQIKNSLRAFCFQQNISFFDLKNQDGLMRNLIIRTASTGELMVIVQFFLPDEKAIRAIMEHLKINFPQITSLLYIVNQKKNETFQDQEVICYAGKDHIIEQMEELKFRVGPKSFYQTNSKQAYNLYKVTRSLADIKPNQLVYDLYTGTGTIATFVAKQAKKVIGIEYIDMAIEDAKVNAKLNAISNVEFYAGDIAKVLNPDFVAKHGKPDIVITDPPRAGMDEKVVLMLIEMSPENIVYVSCNPATQARDIARLKEWYAITCVQPVDMFPHTQHVENVVKLELKNKKTLLL
jgi:23S rRNA (uracil1939-C5)-methyltransferase